MLPALLLHGLQWILACLALDLLFRRVDVRPERLAQSRARHRRAYSLQAGLSTLLVGAAQIWLARRAGPAGGGHAPLILAAPLASLGWLPWWLLWRFGWRKQFPHLYERHRQRRV